MSKFKLDFAPEGSSEGVVSDATYDFDCFLSYDPNCTAATDFCNCNTSTYHIPCSCTGDSVGCPYCTDTCSPNTASTWTCV